MKKLLSVFDSLQELSVREENCLLRVVPFKPRCYAFGWTSPMSFHCSFWPWASISLTPLPDVQSCRLSLMHVCLPTAGGLGEDGEEARVFLLPFPPGSLHHYRQPSQAPPTSLRSTRSRLDGRWKERSHWWVFSFSCGQGWRLWQFSLRNLDCTQPHIKLNSSAFPQLSHWDGQLGACGCVNCAVVIHTYRMCRMEVENIKRGCFDLLNTFLLNLNQHPAI